VTALRHIISHNGSLAIRKGQAFLVVIAQ